MPHDEWNKAKRKQKGQQILREYSQVDLSDKDLEYALNVIARSPNLKDLKSCSETFLLGSQTGIDLK